MLSELRKYFRSFAGGEIAPEMYGRLDLAKNQTGLARCYNFGITPTGVAENRAGSEYVATTKSNGRAWLRTFVRANGQGVLLEMGDSYVRMFNGGNRILGTATGTAVSAVAIDGSAAAVFTTGTSHGLAVNDVVYPILFSLTNSDAIGEGYINSYMGKKFFVASVPTGTTLTLKTQYGAAITMAELFPSPYDGLVEGGFFVVGASPAILELTVPYSYSHERQLSAAQVVDEMAFCHNKYPPAFIKRTDDQTWSFANIAFNATLSAPTNVDGTADLIAAFPLGDPKITYSYVVTSLALGGAESAVSTPIALDNVLRILGDKNTISWDADPDAWRYNIYKSAGGTGVYGYIGSVDGVTFTDDNINSDYSTQPADILTSFGDAGSYPSVIVYHEQRCVYANTPDEPQSFWASGIPGFGYIKASFPPQDNQAFTYRLSSRSAAPILHMTALRDVLIFTGAGVFRLYTTDGGPMTPTSVGAIPVGAYGAAAYVAPQEMGSDVLFPLERGSHLHALSFEQSADGYSADDLSLVAPHLIDGYSWVQTTKTNAPYPAWWGLRSDGLLVGVTYISKQQVYAWYVLELPDGFIESFTAVPEGQHDVLYMSVRRVINGSTVRYIERFRPRFKAGQSQSEAYFVDCGITYRGASTTVVTGLSHLEGQSVVAVVDGRPLGPYTVASGQITVDEAGTVIHVGKGYNSELVTLTLSYEAEGYGTGVEKNISAVFIATRQSSGITAGPDFDHLRSMVSPVDELLGDVPVLQDGVHQIDLDNAWSPDSAVYIRQAIALPASITGLAVDFVSGE